MSRILLIARREYFYNLRRPAYLFAAFGTPLIIIGLWVLIFAFLPSDESDTDFSRLGIVNQADTVSLPVQETITLIAGNEDEAVSYTFVSFESTDAAAQALALSQENGDGDAAGISAYFVIPADYRDTRQVEIVSYEELPLETRGVFNRLMITSFTEELDVPFATDRIIEPVGELTVLSLDSGRETTRDAIPVIVLLPLFFAITFWIAIQTTGSFMVNGLVQEKSNRIVEIISTSVSPFQIMLGKILGLGLLGLSQVLLWGVAAIVSLLVLPQIELFSALEGISIPYDVVLIGLIFFVCGYFFFASMLAGVGVLAGNEQQGNQYTVFVTMPGYFLVMLSLATFIEDPGGTFPLIVSMLPITSPLAMIIRVGYSTVPLWQILLSLGILLASTVVVAWAGAKVFRWGLLMYGKKFTPRDVLGVIFGNREIGVTLNQDEAVA